MKCVRSRTVFKTLNETTACDRGLVDQVDQSDYKKIKIYFEKVVFSQSVSS